MSTVTTKFPVAKHQAKRKGPCPVCGKIVHRTRVFKSTQNPFNVDYDGKPLDFISVMMQARVKAALWEPDFTHAQCIKEES